MRPLAAGGRSRVLTLRNQYAIFSAMKHSPSDRRKVAGSRTAQNARGMRVGRGAHLRISPPSLLIIGNNYLKQLAFGARANSPAPICRSSNYHNPECSRCARRTMLFLKVVMVVSKSQYAWVKNGDAPVGSGRKVQGIDFEKSICYI